MSKEIMATRLKELRGSRSQREIAEAIGVSTSAYAMYEAGERIPRDEVKVRIATYYKKSIPYIFFS